MTRSCFVAYALALILAWTWVAPVRAQPPDASVLAQDLVIIAPGRPPQDMTLTGAMQALNLPSVGIALIDSGQIAWTAHFGSSRPETLYQAASLSKFVTAVAVMRLVQEGRLDLDQDVTAYLKSWRLPEEAHPENRAVTLRRLLSMTAGIGVPGYIGYPPDAPIPSLHEILDGLPPANSPPVRIEITPGTAYAYSGGGYQIIQAVIQDVTDQPFAAAVNALVLGPAGMTDSTFAQPLPQPLVARAATGHRQDGRELPGGWRVLPELAAAGLWSTAGDLAKLVVAIAQAARGASAQLLSQSVVETMLSRQSPGPYGLGATVAGTGETLVLMKRGQNIGYQSFLVLFPMAGQGLVVMTNSDNGSTLANALVRRAAHLYGWPPLSASLESVDYSGSRTKQAGLMISKGGRHLRLDRE